jgi:hypothetical protein
MHCSLRGTLWIRLERRVFFLVLQGSFQQSVQPMKEELEAYLDVLPRGPSARLPTRPGGRTDRRQSLCDTALVFQRVGDGGAEEAVLRAGICGSGVRGRGARNNWLGHRRLEEFFV